MKLTRLELEHFTAFEHAVFDFAPGVNVLIGENGTGKSHVLKLIYCLSEAVHRLAALDAHDPLRRTVPTSLFFEQLMTVFQPETISHLVRRGRATAHIRATWSSNGGTATVELTIGGDRSLAVSVPEHLSLARSTFVPTREVLSMFPGFIASYLKRESAFDRTLYDLCVALDARPLRDPGAARAHLLEKIEAVLGGQVVNEHGQFYLKLPDGQLEAPLVAEGLRKLAMLDYLLLNGTIEPGGFLLWDEPEASLNPTLTELMADIALGLARDDVQLWLATHDYLLTSELALQTQQTTGEIAFFALDRTSASAGTAVERGERLGDLQHNSILKALAELHDREQAAFLEPQP